MENEIRNKDFIGFAFRACLGLLLAAGLIALVNDRIDASQVIHGDMYPQMAELALSGETIAVPANYDERRFQAAVIRGMNSMPQTIVIGSSRGMFTGRDTTGVEDIYNHCVSGAILADDYAILGLYEKRFGQLPARVIIETSPWVFYRDVPEARWMENEDYKKAAQDMYLRVNGRALPSGQSTAKQTENPYLSLSYFQYNLEALRKSDPLSQKEARVSRTEAEKADLPDGTIRYEAQKENASEQRLQEVKDTTGPITYHDLDRMESPDEAMCAAYENLLRYLKDQGVKTVIFMAPFSATQCYYIYEQGLDPGVGLTQDYLEELGRRDDIPVVGGYDARTLGLGDEYFIDYMHLDRSGNKILWDAAGEEQDGLWQ